MQRLYLLIIFSVWPLFSSVGDHFTSTEIFSHDLTPEKCDEIFHTLDSFHNHQVYVNGFLNAVPTYQLCRPNFKAVTRYG